MGWPQIVLGAVVGQVAEWMRERRSKPLLTGGGPMIDERPGEQSAHADPPESERAIGGKLNPLNATEDMLRRVIDHAQFRTDQTLRKGVEELRLATERQWPLMSENAQLAAERTVELGAERLEGSAKRIAEDVAARTAIVIDEKLTKADLMLTKHREDMARQVTRLVLLLGAVALFVGVALIILAAALR